ncbi:MAG: hypothetical protein F4Z61_03990, partial [Acidimicrobiia bacterium]|nr:hypothetical protein [Acidimicrobiia bacterium]
VWDVTASGGDLENLNGMVTLGFASDQNIPDRAGNGLDTTATPSPNDNSYIVDNTAPTVTTDLPTDFAAASATVTLTFDEPVTGFSDSDITVDNGATASNFAADTSNPTTVWTVTVATGSDSVNGTPITLTIPAGAVQDAAGNANAAFEDTAAYTRSLQAPATLSATAGDARVALAWTAPADSAGTAALTKYQYRYGTGSPVTWQSWTDVPDGDDDGADVTDETGYVVTGLTNGTAYSFEVRAVNAAGDGLVATASATPASGANTAPTGADRTVTTDEDTAYTFTAADFGFSDADPGDTLSGVKITALESAGALALDGTDVTADQVIAKADIDANKLTFTPAADANGSPYATFGFKVNDGTDDSADAYTLTINVSAVNDAPTVATVIPDQMATAGTAFSYAFPAGTFSDVDSGDTLTYSAAKSDDADLPPWLSFTPATRTFSGTPAAADAGLLMVKVTASDGNGGTVSDTFTLTVNNPLPEITVTGGSAVTEGTGAEFTVTASPAPSADLTVRLTVADDDTSDFVAPTDEGDKTVIIQSGTASATYTVATTADSIDEADGAVRVTVKADPAYTLDGPVTDTVTVTDDDEAGVAVTETEDGTTVSEDGTVTDSYQVVLATQPSANVTIAVTSDDTDAATVDSDTLTFTPGNWNQPQSVTVTGVDDDIDQSTDRTVSISHVATSEDTAYGGIEVASVSVTVSDDDEAAVGFVEAASTVPERAGTHEVTLRFDVVSAAPLELRYSLSGTATAGRDFTAGDGVLRVPAQAREVTLPVTILDDGEQEADETVVVTLIEDRGGQYRLGSTTTHTLTITDDDSDLAERVVRPALARFGRTVGEQVLDAVTDRLGAARTPGFEGRFAGEALPDVICDDGKSAPDHVLEDDDRRRKCVGQGRYEPGSGRPADPSVAAWSNGLTGGPGGTPEVQAKETSDILPGTSFALTSETENGAALAFWGRGAQSGFSGRAGDLGLEGEVTSFMLGADQARDDWLFGLMLSRSRGEIDYTLGAASGEMETDLTALVPYMGWDVSDRLSVWGAAGLGSGDMRLRPEDGSEFRTDIDWGMAAAGADGAL